MDNTTKVTTRFNSDEIRQTVTDPNALGVAEAFTEHLMNLREQQVRDALKKLGWIPPSEAAAMKANWQAEALDKALEKLVPRMLTKADAQIVRDTIRAIKTPGSRQAEEPSE